MGIIKHFSSDSRDFNKGKNIVIERINSTPDPSEFTILKEEIVNNFPIF